MDVPSSTLIAVVDHINQAMEQVPPGLVMDYRLRARGRHLHQGAGRVMVGEI